MMTCDKRKYTSWLGETPTERMITVGQIGTLIIMLFIIAIMVMEIWL